MERCLQATGNRIMTSCENLEQFYEKELFYKCSSSVSSCIAALASVSTDELCNGHNTCTLTEHSNIWPSDTDEKGANESDFEQKDASSSQKELNDYERKQKIIREHTIGRLSIEPSKVVIDTKAEIQTGAFGTIRKAKYLGQPVAVKTLKIEDNQLEDKEMMKELLVKEVLLMADLTHQNIIRITGICLDTQAKDQNGKVLGL